MDFFNISNPPGGGFSLFDGTHLAWLLGTAVCAAVLCLIHRRLTEKGRRVMQRTVGLTLMGIYAVKQLILVMLGEYSIGYLPLHLCGMSVYIETIDSLFPTKFSRELCYALSMPGAAIGMLYANWTAYPVFSLIHITSFVLHGIMVIYPLLALTSGDHRPSLRRMPWCFGFLLAVSIPVYFFNRHFGTNYMFLSRPSPGSPLEWFEALLGNPGYLLGFAVMIAIVWLIMYLPFALTEKKAAGEGSPTE